MQSSDAHLPRVPQQKQQKSLKESQTTSSAKKDMVRDSSVLNQTAFTDITEAAVIAQTSNTTNQKTDNSIETAKTLQANVTDSNASDTTQHQASSDTTTGVSTDKHEDVIHDKEIADVETPPAKKQHRKKPRIIFHPEDECRRSSRPSDDEENVVTNAGDGVVDDREGDVSAEAEVDLEQEASSSKEEKVDKSSKQQVDSVPSPGESNHLPAASKAGGTATSSQHQYTDTYQNSEFRPYNPLSHTVEERLFPRPFGPANFFDYPSWPDKTECLDVVENLSSWVKSSRMDIDMADRGHE